MSFGNYGPIYTQGDCNEGRSDMRYAQAVFEQLGKPAKYAAAMAALVAAFDYANEEAGTMLTAPNLACAEVQRLGAQARQLADQMLREAGVNVAPNPPAPPGLLDELKAIAIGFAVGAAIYYGAQALSRRERP